MIFFVGALRREPHGEMCTESFFIARFASYPDESRTEPGSALDPSFIQMNLAAGITWREIRIFTLHVCRSTQYLRSTL